MNVDSGTPDSPIVYQPYNFESVHIIGGTQVPASCFVTVTDSKALSAIDPTVINNVNLQL